MGPSALRYAGLEERLTSLGFAVRDQGNVETAVAEERLPGTGGAVPARDQGEPASGSRPSVVEAVESGAIPLVLGGDHSVALGTLGGLASTHGPGGVLWIDAHSDINTPETQPERERPRRGVSAPRSVSAARSSQGDAWPLPAVDPRRVALLGVSTWTTESDTSCARRRCGVHDERDRPDRASGAMREAVDAYRRGGFVHVSLDLDALDPEIAPGVGTPVRGGLTYREARLALELDRRVRARGLARGGGGEPDPRPREHHGRSPPSSWLRARWQEDPVVQGRCRGQAEA